VKSLGKNSRVVGVTLLSRHLHCFVTRIDDDFDSFTGSVDEFGQALVTNTSEHPRISSLMTD